MLRACLRCGISSIFPSKPTVPTFPSAAENASTTGKGPGPPLPKKIARQPQNTKRTTYSPTFAQGEGMGAKSRIKSKVIFRSGAVERSRTYGNNQWLSAKVRQSSAFEYEWETFTRVALTNPQRCERWGLLLFLSNFLFTATMTATPLFP